MNHSISQPDASGATLIVIFDGDCGICNALRHQVEARDRSHHLRFVAYQSADLSTTAPGISRDMASRSIYAVRQDGRRWKGARAVFEALRRLPGLWGWIGALGALPLLRLLGEPLYRLIAHRRGAISRWLGMNQCALDTHGNERVMHEP